MSGAKYPDEPSPGQTDTSARAAADVAPIAAGLQRLVLEEIVAAGARGLTTNEVAAAVRIDRGSIQPRTSELRKRGLIRDNGQRRANANGKSAIVWVAA